MFKKYQIVIFREHHGACHKLRFRGWIFATVLSGLAALVAGNAWLIKYYYNYKQMEREATAFERQAKEQNIQLLSLGDKVKTLEADLIRMRGLDAKLRRMVGLAEEPREVSPDGPDDRAFEKKYLPLYRQEMLTRKLHQFLAELDGQAAGERLRQRELLDTLAARQDYLPFLPMSWPVAGWISSPFGERVSAFTGKKEFHKGVDIAAPVGTPVLAPGDGVVAFAGETDGGGFGLTLDHHAGLVTVYGHLDDVVVAKGQTVTRGELLGHVGDSGQSTGPHLHYEARLGGMPVNPLRYIVER